jgi:hypothetical protein
MLQQLPLGHCSMCWNSNQLQVTSSERTVLRELATQVAALAARPIEAEKRELWYRHNDLQGTRPLIFCDPENGWNEIIPPVDLRCEGELAQTWEMALRKEIYWGTKMLDDRVVEGMFYVPCVYTETDWGLRQTMIKGTADNPLRTDSGYEYRTDGGSFIWDSPLRDYQVDFSLLRRPAIAVDEQGTKRMVALANDVLGDVLPVRLKTIWWWSHGLTLNAVFLRGLNQFMLDMVDYPEDVHRMMAFLRDSYLARLDFLETNGLLSLNNDGSYVGSGGFGWTRELPQPDFAGKVRTKDMWGNSESQETVGISPAMFSEFIFPYQLPLMERFGLNCYGCCEPLDKRWYVIERTPRLRRVSVSPWASVREMAEKLGKRFIFSWKPRPADLATPHFDEDEIRHYLREMLRATSGCHVELIMKDNHTLQHEPQRVIRWVQIAREEVMRLC